MIDRGDNLTNGRNSSCLFRCRARVQETRESLDNVGACFFSLHLLTSLAVSPRALSVIIRTVS